MVICQDIHVDQLSNLHRVTLLYLGLSICVLGCYVLLNILPYFTEILCPGDEMTLETTVYTHNR